VPKSYPVLGRLEAPKPRRSKVMTRVPGDIALVLDSADDHEALHTYSLSGIVMYVRNALLRQCRMCRHRLRDHQLWHA
jgi:hypothetical protein